MKKMVSLLTTLFLLLSCVPLGVATEAAETYEYAMFPMEYLNISQGMYEGYSHQGKKALDIIGKGSGIDIAYAPFTGEVKRIYDGHGVWFQSSNKVRYADGTIDYMTIMVAHDNDVSDLYVGKKIQQGQRFYEEGTNGQASGNHIHIECGKGKYTGTGWHELSNGKWTINNSIEPYKALYISPNTIVKEDYGYSWKTVPHSAHDFRNYIDYEAAHPHYKRYKCYCGTLTTNKTQTTSLDYCAQCNPPAKIDANSFWIQNRGNGLYLTVENDKDAGNTNILTSKFNNGLTQLFAFIPHTDGVYFMRPDCCASRVVNVYSPTVSSGINVCTYPHTGNTYQQWRFEKVEKGHLICNVQQPSCVLSVSSDGNVCVSTYTGAASQVWLIRNSVAYNANGGSGAPSQQGKNYDEPYRISDQVPTREGYQFLGWSTTATAAQATFAPGDVYTKNENLTLYAVWKKPETVALATQPNSAYYAPKGERVSVPIRATGDRLTYEWYIKNSGSKKYARSSVTSATYSVKMSDKVKDRLVFCRVYDQYGNMVQSKTVRLRESASITKEPATAAYAQKGAKVSVDIVASGDDLTYAWYIKNAGGSKYSKSSVTSATYATTMSSTSKNRRVYCIVTDKYGKTVQSKTFLLREAVSITAQPKSMTVKKNATVKVRVKASGDGLKYTWYIKNEGQTKYSKSSVTSATYSTTMNAKSKNRLVYCVVTDKYGNTARCTTVKLKMK